MHVPASDPAPRWQIDPVRHSSSSKQKPCHFLSHTPFSTQPLSLVLLISVPSLQKNWHSEPLVSGQQSFSAQQAVFTPPPKLLLPLAISTSVKSVTSSPGPLCSNDNPRPSSLSRVPSTPPVVAAASTAATPVKACTVETAPEPPPTCTRFCRSRTSNTSASLSSTASISPSDCATRKALQPVLAPGKQRASSVADVAQAHRPSNTRSRERLPRDVAIKARLPFLLSTGGKRCPRRARAAYCS
mmetsp:Transcript_92505/g.205537  ORF Transcript_92505/g.205537 Transcript_92505/m.205537 type:complete len:243 (+) Transcript_92505:4048-4776(+)